MITTKIKSIRSLLIERSPFQPVDSLRETGRDLYFGLLFANEEESK